MSCVEVRDTELSSICKPVFKLTTWRRQGIHTRILSVIEGGEGSEEARAFVELIKESEFCVIFGGRGLIYSLNGDFDLFNKMVAMLSQRIKVAVIPMIDEFNMLGFNKSLHGETGHINK